jgi:hypothetical protein
MWQALESLPRHGDRDLRDWDPGYLAVKENGCSCIFAVSTNAAHVD